MGEKKCKTQKCKEHFSLLIAAHDRVAWHTAVAVTAVCKPRDDERKVKSLDARGVLRSTSWRMSAAR